MSDFIVPSLNMDMFRFYRELRVGEFILLFVDTAGEGSDWNAGHSLSKSNLDILRLCPAFQSLRGFNR